MAVLRNIRGEFRFQLAQQVFAVDGFLVGGRRRDGQT
jgi:hypothetical protein